MVKVGIGEGEDLSNGGKIQNLFMSESRKKRDKIQGKTAGKCENKE